MAEVFGKQHGHVLRDIAEISKNLQAPNLEAEWFRESTYVGDNGKTLPCTNLTRDGFMLLVMGYTGKDATRSFNTQRNAVERTDHPSGHHR